MTEAALPGPGPAPSSPPRARRPLSRGKKLLFASVALAALFLLAEVATRVVDRVVRGANFESHDPSRWLYEPDPFVQVALRPGAALIDPAETIRVNALGFRGPELDPAKAPGAVRLACVGGSTTFGAGARDDDVTWPRRLEAKLRAAFPGRAIDVVNAGVPGYTTFHDLPNLALRVLPLEPDVVLFYEAVNDLPLHQRLEARPWDHRIVRAKRTHGLFDQALGRSLLLTVLQNQLEDLQRARLEAPTGPLRDAPSQAGRVAFERNLAGLVALTRRAGAEPALLTFGTALVPAPGPDDERRAWSAMHTTGLSYAGLREAYRLYNDIARRVAAEGPARVVEVAPAIDGHVELFTDLVHLTDEGNERIARAAFEGVRDLVAARLVAR